MWLSYFDTKVETHPPHPPKKKKTLHFAKENLPEVKNKCIIFLLTQYTGHHLSFPLFSSLPPALYLSAIRQIVASLICIVSSAIPTGAPRSCSLKDSGATAPSHSPIPWIKLTLGQHQHIMNYGHLPPQTHCSLCSNVGNIEGPGRLQLLTAYSLSYLLGGARAWESARKKPALRRRPPDLYPEFKAFAQTWAWFWPRWGPTGDAGPIFWGKSRSCHFWNF